MQIKSLMLEKCLSASSSIISLILIKTSKHLWVNCSQKVVFSSFHLLAKIDFVSQSKCEQQMRYQLNHQHWQRCAFISLISLPFVELGRGEIAAGRTGDFARLKKMHLQKATAGRSIGASAPDKRRMLCVCVHRRLNCNSSLSAPVLDKELLRARARERETAGDAS